MKFIECTFNDNLDFTETENLHSNDYYKITINNFNNMQNFLIYGPEGIGKYTYALSLIKNLSDSKLKYEKKVIVVSNKVEYIVKISDIHYEIDIETLGCNSKATWCDLYSNIVDMIMAKKDKVGIIICKNFNKINSELLDIFYNFIENIDIKNIDIKIVILTTNIGFIPDIILKKLKKIHMSVPIKKKLNYIKKNSSYMGNLKLLSIDYNGELDNYKIICNNLLDKIYSIDTIDFHEIRELIYSLLVSNCDISECIWYLTSDIINKKKISQDKIADTMIFLFNSLKKYNNNYRPIYHLEKIVFYFIYQVHEL